MSCYDIRPVSDCALKKWLLVQRHLLDSTVIQQYTVTTPPISAHSAVKDEYLFRQTVAVAGLHISDPLLEQVNALCRLF
jgi:hypothetical protein